MNRFDDAEATRPGIRAFDSFLMALRQWRRARRSLRELALLDESQLRDVGLTRGQALFGVGGSFRER